MENLNNEHVSKDWRAPKVREDDTIIFDECGRAIGNVCYRAYHFRLVDKRYGCNFLLVKHGSGEENICLDFFHTDEINALNKLTSDERYLMFFTIYRAYRNTKRLLENKLTAKELEKRKSKKALRELMYVKSSIHRNAY